ncbi:hypothetical protein VP01_87g5 [Puccinia sorghi]|uniref:Tet-like 2OG-Fe(II) oxygenase domain-containing protein n=1 Tax=Puccinia sorghi TaxID=27349 RepID=A0A0L6U942_9BASI|nr:hypothetical protein VP01_87g5 [Puccinia sorghi]
MARLKKERSNQKRKAEEYADIQPNALRLNDTNKSTKASIFWQWAEYLPLKLYPEIPLNQNQNPTRHPLDRKSIIAIIEFTPWDKLTDKDKDDLNFFINIPSWRQGMRAIGWRNSQDFLQVVGQYIKYFFLKKVKKYEKHFTKAKPLATNSTRWMKFKDKPGPLSCSPHLTLTTNSFFYLPPVDKKDLLDYDFVFFLPTYLANGNLAPPDNITGGPFVFPDNKLGINFDHQLGIFKRVWKAKKNTNIVNSHILHYFHF